MFRVCLFIALLLNSSLSFSQNVNLDPNARFSSQGFGVIGFSLDYFGQSLSSLDTSIFGRQMKSNNVVVISETDLSDDDVQSAWSSSTSYSFKVGFMSLIYWVKDFETEISKDNIKSDGIENLFKLGMMFVAGDYQVDDDLNLGAYTAISTIKNRLNYFTPASGPGANHKHEMIEFTYVANANLGYNFADFVNLNTGISYILKSYNSVQVDDGSTGIKENFHAFRTYTGANFADLVLGDDIAFTNFINSSIIYVFGYLNDRGWNSGKYIDFILEYNPGLKFEISTAMGVVSLNPSAILGVEIPKLEIYDGYLRWLGRSEFFDKNSIYWGGKLNIKLMSFSSWDIDFSAKFLDLRKSYFANVGIVVSL